MAVRITKKTLPEKLFPKKEHYSWLIQPAALTFMRYDYSVHEQRIYATIIEVLQKSFNDEKNNVFRNGYPENRLLLENSWDDFRKDFDQKDVEYEKSMDSLPIKIMMKDFGVPSNHYDQLKRDFVNFGFSPVGLRIIGSKGVEWIEYQCLCRMWIPTNLQRINRVYALFTKPIALEMYRAMHAGYTTFMKEVILKSQSKYTPRIYMFLSAYPNKQSCFIPYEELRLYLRLDVSYKDFKNFKDKILCVACEELKILYNKGLSNLYFDYSPVFDGDQVSGISFQIKRFDNIKEIEIPYYDDILKKNLFRLLTVYCGCTDKTASFIVDKSDNDSYQQICLKIDELYKKFSSEFCKVSDMEAYTLKVFENFFKSNSKVV